MITLNAMSTSAIPSRRCPCSISPARLSVRVVAPTPRASIDQPLPIPRPSTASGAVFDRARGAGRRVAEVRPRVVDPRGVDPVRDPAERDRAGALPRVDPARAREVVVPRDLPAIASG
ncbi:hypothetical protein NWFMUON74_23070 [Nocardia wallacei]|uniref:Uncharacterized protein n=1 Tax=Nocardia wallacei TaxID=480035 RepID=A0A7G1KHC4_9NOCA|nr:hypothetical protein NWFMUON74_23070 [Nocardia wallacei]